MQRVEIRAKGHLDKQWGEWLDGLTITHTEQNETILTGSVPDQAALYGLMMKLRDLGVRLLSISFGQQPPSSQVNDCRGKTQP
jgi:hypothetical protein